MGEEVRVEGAIPGVRGGTDDPRQRAAYHGADPLDAEIIKSGSVG